MITVLFDVPGMTSDQYDRSIKELEAVNEGAPVGRSYHVAAAKPGGWFVLDVWDSPETLERFAGVLMPILVKLGVTPPTPTVLPTHNVING